MQNIKTYVYAILSMFIWASTFIWYKEAYGYFEPITIVFYRLVIAGIILEIFCFFTKKNQKIERKDVWIFFVLALCDPFLYFIGESFGIRLISATLGSLIVSTIPLFMPIFAHIILKERVTKKGILGIVISFSGLLLVILDNLELSGTFVGILLMFVCVFSGVGYSLISKKLTEKYSSFFIVKVQSQIAALYFLPLYLLYDFSKVLSSPFIINEFYVIIKLSLLGSIIAFILYTEVVKRKGPTTATMFTNLIPVFTAVLAYLILGEKITFLKVLGIAIVVIGLFVAQSKVSKKEEMR